MFDVLNRLNVRNRVWAMIMVFMSLFVFASVVDLLVERKEFWHEKELKTRGLVEIAYRVVEHHHGLQQRGVLTQAEAQAAAIRTLRVMRGAEREYYWINDLGTPYPRMVMHPTLPAYEGQLLNAEKFDRATSMQVGTEGRRVATAGRNRNLFVAFVEVVNEGGEGFVTYEWPKPLADGSTTAEPYTKLSFVRKFEPWGWIVGSGVYVDDVDAAFKASLASHLGVVVGIAALMLLAGAILARSITRPLGATVELMREIAGSGDLTRRLPAEGRNEICLLAGGFNEMLERLQARDVELARYREQLEEEVARRTFELRTANGRLEEELIERRQLSEALRQSDEAIIVADPDLHFIYVNPAFERLFGYRSAEVVGQPVSIMAPQGEPGPGDTARIAREQGSFRGETLRRAKDGRDVPVLLTVAAVNDAEGRIVGYVAAMADLTELRHAANEVHARMTELSHANDELRELNARLEQAQNQLLHSEKMASIGILAAGVAHEINNPVGYVKSNNQSLACYVEDFLRIIAAYEAAAAKLPAHEEAFAEVRRLQAELDLAYKKGDVLSLLAESCNGLDRVTTIVRNLKDFSHVDAEETWREEDLHAGIDSTLSVVWNQLKYHCEVRKEYGELPAVECVLPQLNQVFMNLLVNAAQAIKDHGIITIRTGTEGEEVWVEVADSGEGIAPEHLRRVFDPFFTTKPVGKGTGLGLSVSYSIVQKHHGRIEVASEADVGTRFRLWLPVRQPAETAPAPSGSSS